MNAAAWIAVFQKVLPAYPHPHHPTEGATIRPVRFLLVDGTHWLAEHIGLATCRNAEALVRDLGTFVESEAKAMDATRAHIVLESALCPAVHALYGNNGVSSVHEHEAVRAVEKHLDMGGNWHELASALHGDLANTKWPKLLEPAEPRRLLWRLPLFEWQIYAHLDAYMARRLRQLPNRFPAALTHVTVGPVPSWPLGKTGKDVFQHYMLQTDREFYDKLLTVSGHYFKQRTKTLLATLTMGYRTLARHTYRLPGATQQREVNPGDLDVYGQIMDVLDVHLSHLQPQQRIYHGPEVAAKMEKLSVRVRWARASSLWTFLLWVHRLALRGLPVKDMLDLVVFFDQDTTAVDMGVLYVALLHALPPRTMDSFIYLGMAQLEAPPGEQEPMRMWHAFARLAAMDEIPLYRVPTTAWGFPEGPLAETLFAHVHCDSGVMQTMGRLSDVVSLSSTSLEPAGIRWSASFVSTRVAGHMGLLLAQMAVWSELEARHLTSTVIPKHGAGLLLPVAVVQTAFYQHLGGGGGTTQPPSLPSECWARARRAQWCYNYYFNEPLVAIQHVYADRFWDLSYWGWEQFEASIDQLGTLICSTALCLDTRPSRDKSASPFHLLGTTNRVYREGQFLS